MMIPDKIQLVVHYVMWVISIENFVETRAQLRHPSYGNQSQSNVREIYYTTNLDHQRESRSSTEIPVSFKAPDVGSQNFWNYHYASNSPNRRMFLGDLGYFNYGKTNLFSNLNSFFDFINPLASKENAFKPMPPAATKSVSEPYRYEYPYNFGETTERTFLPPPKPIRASIVKLETITRSPDSFEYVDSSDLPRFSNFKPVPPVKPISLYIDELGFHPTHNIKFKQEHGLNSQPEQFSTSHFMNNITSTIYIPSSAEVYQHSVKVTPSRIRQILINNNNDTEKPDVITKEKIKTNKESSNVTYNSNDSLNVDPGKNFREYGSNEKSHINEKGPENRTTSVKYKDSKSTPQSEVEETRSIQTASPHRRGNSIKIVTELTLEGLSKNNKTANIPRYPKFINMSGLISYELNKIKQNKIPRPRLDETEEREEFLGHALGNRSFTDVNTSDELSLDLKILKDTNWDGFSTEVSPISELMETGATEKESKLQRQNLNPEIVFSYDSNNGNDSKAHNTDDKERTHDNKTIIVETRVTKSITKALPTTRRKTYKKSASSETIRNVIKQISSSNNFRNHTSKRTNSKSGVVPQLSKEKDYTSSTELTSNEASNSSQNVLSNETIVGNNVNVSKEKELTLNLRRFNFTHSSTNKIYGKISRIPYVSQEVVSDEIPVNKTTTTEITETLNVENQTNNTEEISTSNIMTITKELPYNIQNETEHIEVKSIRKRKPKRRQKLKRRRNNGKRRQNNTVTKEESNDKSIISEAKIS